MFKKWLITLAVSLSFSAAVLGNSAQDGDQQRKLAELKAMIKQLQTELQKVKSNRDGLEKDLEKSEADIGELLKNIDIIKKDLGANKDQLSKLQTERDTLKKAKRGQQQHIAGQVAAAYRLGQQSNIKLLLNQQSPEDVARMMKYYDYFIDARAEKIDTYIETLSEIERIEPAIIEKTAQLESNRQTLQQRHNSLHQRQLERTHTLATLNRSINSKDQQLKKVADDSARLQKLINQMAEAIASLPTPGGGVNFSKLKGRLPWPTQGKLRHNYGSSREGTRLKWDGVVIAANAGRDVSAVHGGRIIFSDYLRGHGLLTIIDHGHGYMSLYAHNQSLFREIGDWVETGDTIASVGNSGGREEAGLYFEIRKNGAPTNPKAWLRKA